MARSSPLQPKPVSDDPATRLLSVAGPIFARHGFAGATVREIATAADVNVAAVSYYFGDKMGLYRAVLARVRQQREHAFPLPQPDDKPPAQTLQRLVRTLLSRLMTGDDASWEMVLMMREMQQPTAVLDEIIDEYFRPFFQTLCQVLAALVPRPEGSDLEGQLSESPRWYDEALIPQLALSVVGQCLYYRIGNPVVQKLFTESQRAEFFHLDALCEHITATTLAACDAQHIVTHRKALNSAFSTESTSTYPTSDATT